VAEDFVVLYSKKETEMIAYEKKYYNVNGTGFESEIAKILARGKTEGRRVAFWSEKKVVRFNEDVDEISYEEGNYSQIWEHLLPQFFIFWLLIQLKPT